MLSAVLDAIDQGVLEASLGFVFVNRARGQTEATDRYLDLVESRGIPLVTLSSRDFRRRHGNAPWATLRTKFDAEVLAALAPHPVDVGIQAGYMLYAPLLCREMLLMNQHPALPGGTVGIWQDAVWDVITNRSRESGSMVHVSTEDLDRGPVVSYCRFPVVGNAWDALWSGLPIPNSGGWREMDADEQRLFDSIRQAGLLRERSLVVRTLAAIADGRVSLNQLVTGTHADPLDLTPHVEADVADQLAREASQAC